MAALANPAVSTTSKFCPDLHLMTCTQFRGAHALILSAEGQAGRVSPPVPVGPAGLMGLAGPARMASG